MRALVNTSKSFGIFSGADESIDDIDWVVLTRFLSPVALSLQGFDASKLLTSADAMEPAGESDVVTIVRLVSRAADLALELFENDEGRALAWMTTPTSFLFDMSPVEVVLCGNGATVIDTQLEWLGRDLG